jgi:para-nitrobenzyl esterase
MKVLATIYGEHADEAFDLYHATSDDDVVGAATDLAGDRFAGFNTWKWMELHIHTGNSPVYRYYYSRPRPGMRSEMGNVQAGFAGGVVPGSDQVRVHITGAVHSAEIEYALGNLPSNRVYDWQPEDYKVSAVMQGFFANFIKTQNPNGIGLPEWPASNENIDVQMHIDVESKSEIDPHAERYSWLNQLPAKYTNTPE